MNFRRWMLPVVFVGVLSVTAAVQEKGGTDDTGPYTVVANWFKPLKAGFLERGCGVFAETPNRVFVTTDLQFVPPAAGGGGAAAAPRPAPTPHPTIQVLDQTGKLVEEWTQWENLLKMPHAVTESPYDPEKNVWVIDRDNSQIFKFTNDGKKLLLTLGEKGVLRTDDTHFARPANIAFLPDGSFYVADGYDGKRIVKLDKNGKIQLQWGSAGSGPGQFAENGQVHAVAVDAQGRVYAGDRGNKRVQVFDAKGKFLDEWDNVQGPSDIKITQDGFAWVTSGVGNRLAKYDLNGKLLTYFGMHGLFPGGFDDPHNLNIDSAGNLYVSIWSTQKSGIEKYAPKPNADKTRLVTPMLVMKKTT